MRVLTIQRDVKGRAYEELVRLFGGHAAACQLVSHRAPTTLTGKEALSVLSNLDETTAEVSEWCGTRLPSGNKAILHTFPVNEKSLSFLTSHVDSLFSWRWPDEPEDLCFLASDGSPILISTAHEQFARLVIADGMCVSGFLKSALDMSAEKKLPRGFVVTSSKHPFDDMDYKGYVGIEVDGWPVDLPDMPMIDHGLAPVDELRRCVAYRTGLMKLDDSGSVRLLYFGEHPPCAGFCTIGFDCGFYSNEIDNFSLVLDLLHKRSVPSLSKYKRILNEYGLFATCEAAMSFLNHVLSDQHMSSSYRGVSEDFLVVKVHSYFHK